MNFLTRKYNDGEKLVSLLKEQYEIFDHYWGEVNNRIQLILVRNVDKHSTVEVAQAVELLSKKHGLSINISDVAHLHKN